MGQGNLANLLKQAERKLFLANKQFASAQKLFAEIGEIFQSISQAKDAGSEKKELGEQLDKLMKESRVVSQSRALFKNLDLARHSLQLLEGSEQAVRPFIERYRRTRVYAFENSANATKFARQLLEMFSVQSAFFKPRFAGTMDLSEISSSLKLPKSKDGLLLQPKDLKLFVNFMLSKKFASNILLDSPGLRLAWQDKKTVAVDSHPERLYRADKLCEGMQGKCLES